MGGCRSGRGPGAAVLQVHVQVHMLKQAICSTHSGLTLEKWPARTGALAAEGLSLGGERLRCCSAQAHIQAGAFGTRHSPVTTYTRLTLRKKWLARSRIRRAGRGGLRGWERPSRCRGVLAVRLLVPDSSPWPRLRLLGLALGLASIRRICRQTADQATERLEV